MTPAEPPLRAWRLRRNCALSPRQSLLGWAPPLLLLALMAGTAGVLGQYAIALLCVVVAAAIGVAVVVHARHALDGESLQLCGTALTVLQVHGQRSSTTVFDARRTVVDWPVASEARVAAGLITLRCGGTALVIGRELAPAQRERFARDIAAALRVHRAAPPAALAPAPADMPQHRPQPAFIAAWAPENWVPHDRA